MFYLFNQVVEKAKQKILNQDTEEKKTSSKDDKNDISGQKSNILATNLDMSQVFNSIKPENKERLFVIASTVATGLLFMYLNKEKVSNTKKGVQNGIKACQEQWIKHKNKKDAKERLKQIALDYKNFSSVTVQDLEEIFLPHNLDWINDLYQSGLCVCYDKEKNTNCFEFVLSRHDRKKNTNCPDKIKIINAFLSKLDTIMSKISDGTIKPYTVEEDTKIFFKPEWIKPHEHAQEYPVLFFEDTLLTIACRAGNFDVCKWLLEHGADPNLRGKKKGLSYIFGDAPLFACLHNKNPEQIRPYLELLFAHGANPNVFSYIQAVSKDYASYIQTTYKYYTGQEIHESDYSLSQIIHKCSTFSYEILKDFACGCIENEDLTFCNHSASCDNIKMLIRHEMLIENSEIFRLLMCPSTEGKFETFHFFSKMSKTLAKQIRLNPLFWERVLFDGFDPNQEDIVWTSFCAGDYNHISQKNWYRPYNGNSWCYESFDKEKVDFFLNENDEPFLFEKFASNGICQKKYLSLLRVFLRYGRKVQLLSGQISLETSRKECLEDLIGIKLKYTFEPLLQEEYEFRQAFLNNPQQLFLDLMKRCKRPELLIKRMAEDMDISQEEQNKLIKDVCLQSLLLFNNILKGQQSEFYLPDLSKTVCYVLDDVYQKKLINCDDEIKITTTNIILDSLYTLYELQGLEKLVEEDNDHLQQLRNDEINYKNNAFPFINFCSNNPQYVNWLQKKNNMNMFHLLAYGIDNNLLKNMMDSLKRYDIFFLEKVLNEPMNLTQLHNDTYTTPLYIAQQQAGESTLSKEAALLFLTAENEIKSKYEECIAFL